MGNEDDALPVPGQIPHDADQILNLLGGEGGGGLVQNQDVRPTVQRLQNLHTLLHAHGDVLNFRVGVDGKTVALGNLLHIFPGLRHIQGNSLSRLGAQHDILCDGEGLDQHEVLMHHADSRVDGVPGIAHFNGFAVDQDLAGGGLEKAVKLVHQRGFARAVFAQDRMDFTFVDSKVDAVIGHEIAEFFDNIPHFNDGGIQVHELF